jgi:hypothetical protein
MMRASHLGILELGERKNNLTVLARRWLLINPMLIMPKYAAEKLLAARRGLRTERLQQQQSNRFDSLLCAK